MDTGLSSPSGVWGVRWGGGEEGGEYFSALRTK